MSDTTTLTIRLDSAVKAAARSRARRLGISLGTLVENDLRRFINGHPIIIDDESIVPPERLLAELEAAEAERERGEFTAVEPADLDAYLAGLSGRNE
jgi:antitoxin component of RelBE/YafQ-DinJ toxin-antitoxin module